MRRIPFKLELSNLLENNNIPDDSHGVMRIKGSNSADTLYGGINNDKLFGRWGPDFLYGGDGRDYLFGGGDDDWLHGGAGNDKLSGGSGADTYHFNVIHDSNGVRSEGRDTITHFDANDSLSFGGDIHSLSDLSASLDSISHRGSKVKLMFLDGGSITLYGRFASKIVDVDTLSQQLNVQFNHEYRHLDGFSNNIYQPNWGQADTQFIRLVPSEYADGLSAPAGESRPSAREISNVIFDQDASLPNPFGASDLFWLWGQFVDHDIDLIQGESGERFDIPVPLGDPDFDPFFTGSATIMLTRSGYDLDTGTSSPREHLNAITAFLDASMVYGSDKDRAAFLRGENGKLKMSGEELMPFNNGEYENAPSMETDMYLAGDIRANENIALTSLHTLFVREHNRWVDVLSQEHPEYNSEILYQEAKVRVEALIQKITYNEFLPLLLGENSIASYAGYDHTVDPSISNTFAAAAYRLGHTLLSSEIERLNEDGSIHGEHLALRDAFFRPDIIQEPGQLESIFRGMAQGVSESIDTQIVDEVRNFLFGPPGAGGFDLASLNIQRGRDHGLPDYNTLREAFGLDRVELFSDITSDANLQAKLAQLYTDVDNIDVFVGGLAEDAVMGSMLGELFHTIVSDQFTRLRDGDRLWYENRLTDEARDDIMSLNFADIITLNSDVDIIQDNPFISHQRIGGDQGNNTLMGTLGSDLIIGFEGNDTLTGQTGADQFAFDFNHGDNTITDFDPNEDKLLLKSLQVDLNDIAISSNALGAHIQVANVGIQLLDVDISQLSSENFII